MIKPLPHQRIQFHAYSLYHYNNLQGLCTNLHSKQQVLRHDDNHTSHSNTLFHRKDEYEF